MAGMSPLFRRRAPQTPEAPETAVAAESPVTAETAEQPPSSPRSRNHLVTLVRKPGCHLCDDAQLVVEKVCAGLGVPWETKDITEDRRLHDQYWEQIPVVLVDGRQHTFWRVNEERLRRALTDQSK
jgi:hypothetical protein